MAWWCTGYGTGLATKQSRVRIPAVHTLGKLFTHVCLFHQAVQFGTGRRTVMPWEGNRRSGVALAMCYRLLYLVYRPTCSRPNQQELEYLAVAPLWVTTMDVRIAYWQFSVSS